MTALFGTPLIELGFTKAHNPHDLIGFSIHQILKGDRYKFYFFYYYLEIDMKVKCPRCGYVWNYRGKLMSATCPNCLYRFRIRREKSEER